MTNRSHIYVTLCSIALAIAAFLVGTENVSSQSFTSQPNLVLTPALPGPYEEVSIRAESNVVQLDGARFVWTVNGREVEGGTGVSTVTLQTGAVGERMVVSMMAETPGGRVVSAQTTIVPSEVDLIWEAESYVPPFYKGKALLPANGVVRVAALPDVRDENGVRYNSGNLIYTWKYNGTVHQNQSGFGKTSARFAVPTRLTTIGVEVSNREGDILAAESVVVRHAESTVRMYELSPLRGIVASRALANVSTLEKQEVVIATYPYYFSVDSRNDDRLEYLWFVDDRAVNTDDRTHITLRSSDGGSRSALRMGVLHDSNRFQRALQEVVVTLLGNAD